MPQTMFYSAPQNPTGGFQLWGQQGVSAALAVAGLVKTTDTGQINWTTVTPPVSANISAGYEIWRLNDSLQATAPVFFKFEFGSGNPVGTPAMWVTVGTGTDGAGTITGIMISRRITTPNGTSTSTYASYATGDGSSFALALWAGASATLAVSFLFERSRNASGAPTAEAIWWDSTTYASGVQNYWAVVPYGQLDTLAGTIWGTTASPLSGPATIGGNSPGQSQTISKDINTIPVMLIPLFGMNVTPWTSQLCVWCWPPDVGAGSLVQLTVNGSSHTYRSISNTFATGFLTNGGSANYNSYPLFLWE